MNRKFSIVLLGVLILAIIGFLIYTSNKDSVSEEYHIVLSQIEDANNYVMERDADDSCYPYRIFNRGCYYDRGKGYLEVSSLKSYNLTYEEKIDLCYKFAHKGGTAYCLSRNNEKQKCNNFSGNNTYLNRVCNLEEGEIIPSQKFGPYNEEEIDFLGIKIDSWDKIEIVSYSDLI